MRLLVAILLAGSSAPLLNAQPDADALAVRSLVQQYVHAREQQDPAAVQALFTADADQLVSSGEWRRGRDALVKGALASSQATGGKRSIEVTSVRFLTPDVAVADGRYTLANMKNGEDRRMWTTIIVRRQAGAWRIAAIRNMLPAPPAAP